jgi:hypothetical protein
MPAEIALFSDADLSDPFETIRLGDVDVVNDYGVGEPKQIFVKNTGTTNLREIVVNVEGPGAGYVQLAVDKDGSPGAWQSPGRAIKLDDGTVFKGASFSFWSRGMFSLDDIERIYPFEFAFDFKSIGA